MKATKSVRQNAQFGRLIAFDQLSFSGWIVFGGWGNSRIIVRKATGEELKFGQVNQVLDANKKRVFLIQITNGK